MIIIILSGFTVLGIDYFFGDPISIYLDKDSIKEGFDIVAWIAKSRKGLKRLFRGGSRKNMVDISYTERFQFDFFYIGAKAKYSAVG
jgi:hypothetical protein